MKKSVKQIIQCICRHFDLLAVRCPFFTQVGLYPLLIILYQSIRFLIRLFVLSPAATGGHDKFKKTRSGEPAKWALSSLRKGLRMQLCSISSLAGLFRVQQDINSLILYLIFLFHSVAFHSSLLLMLKPQFSALAHVLLDSLGTFSLRLNNRNIFLKGHRQF